MFISKMFISKNRAVMFGVHKDETGKRPETDAKDRPEKPGQSVGARVGNAQALPFVVNI